MKRILIIAALVAAALVGRAQSEADTVSVMLRHLQDTNAELVALNKAYTTHAFMVAGGAAVMTAGLLWARGTDYEAIDPSSARIGYFIAAVGAATIVASVFTMPKGVTLDGRGLIVRPSEVGKKKK